MLLPLVAAVAAVKVVRVEVTLTADVMRLLMPVVKVQTARLAVVVARGKVVRGQIVPTVRGHVRLKVVHG